MSEVEARSRWVRLAPLVLATMASQALLVVLSPTVAAVADDLGASVGAVGQARSVTAAAAVATSLAIVARFGSVGVPRLLAVGAVMGVVACAAVAMAPDLPLFLAAHLLVGAAFACLLSGGFAGIAGFPQGERPWAMGYLAGANALAWVVVNPLVGSFAQGLTWRAGQAVPGLIVLAALVGARRAAPVPCAQAAVPLRTLLADASARRWVLSELVAYGAWTGLLTFVGAYFIEVAGAGEAQAGWLLAAGAAAYLVSSTRSRALVSRYPRRQLVAGSALVMAALLPVLLQLGSAGALAAAGVFCLVGLAAGVRTPASGGLGLDQAPGQPKAMMATRTAVTQLGYLLGAAAGGLVIATVGYGALGVTLAVAMVVAGLLALGVRDPMEHPAVVAAGPGDHGPDAARPPR